MFPLFHRLLRRRDQRKNVGRVCGLSARNGTNFRPVADSLKSCTTGNNSAVLALPARRRIEWRPSTLNPLNNDSSTSFHRCCLRCRRPHAGPLRRARVRLRPGDDHLSGPCLHRLGGQQVRRCAGPGLRGRAELGTRGFPVGLCAVRGAHRLARRRLWAAPGPDPHCALLVRLHCPDRADRHVRRRARGGPVHARTLVDHPLDEPGGDPVPLRRVRGRGLSQHHAGAAQLAPPEPAGDGPGRRLDVQPAGRRIDALDLGPVGRRGHGQMADASISRGGRDGDFLEGRVLGVCRDWRRLVPLVRLAVPQPAGREKDGQRGRAGPDPHDGRRIAGRSCTVPGAASWPAAISGCSA